MVRVTPDDLDELEFAAVQSGDHARIARRLAELADRLDPASEVPRAEVFIRAGEQWEMASCPEIAIQLYQRAIDDGGATLIDARALLAGALFELDQLSDAYHQLERLRTGGPHTLETYIVVAELLQAHGDLAAAHEWATIGARAYRDAPLSQDQLIQLLQIRFRIRVDLGLTEDELDHLLD
ncbi:hypothetical protein [Allonocardiopsis opalescens]|uniref:Tetratricopeptide repeat protein n=1 Tax=Allonocardiopsis opalescens TaxID=1144618 RepID=A0A2T0Q316_9ACTN|nr:hypothetical protein [Allonocardiopsis opalescens]PRX98179.1 hypothetical protein CLV72_105533 [Allonocardiopsis opalescens]